MKCILSIVAVLAFQVSASPVSAGKDGTFDDHNKECISETGVDVDSVRRLIGQPGSDKELLTGNDKMQQYVVCMCKKLDFINAAGLIQKEIVKEFLSGDIMDHPPGCGNAEVNEVADKCAVQKDTLLETATHVFKCIKAETLDKDHELRGHVRKCASETGADDDSIKKLNQPEGQAELLAGDVKLQKYAECLCTRMGLINAEGVVQKDAIKKLLSRGIKDEARVNKIVEKCGVQKETPLETACNIIKCIRAETLL